MITALTLLIQPSINLRKRLVELLAAAASARCGDELEDDYRQQADQNGTQQDSIRNGHHRRISQQANNERKRSFPTMSG